MRKAQSGVEYLMIIGFVSLAVTAILAAAYFYVGVSKDKIRINQIEVLANKIISSSESVFYAGEPSQTTIIIYMPSGIGKIELSEYNLIIEASSSSGKMSRAFPSKVSLGQGIINPGEGTKKLLIKAELNKVNITQK